MAWRSVESLKKLRAQIMEKWPDADPKQFGTIGDAAHQAGTSDHNPETDGTVDALDIPHQPEIGLDAHDLADALLGSHDRRIKYIISDSRIGGDEAYAKRNGVKPWTWGKYTGTNPHDQHIHVSVNDAYQDDPAAWKIDEGDMTVGWKMGKGSWYSQYKGKYTWIDNEDEPNSNALGVPDWAQGISLYDQATKGKWFEVQYPNGVVSIEQQTEIGPNPKTGRLIDISAVAAERAGYSPKTFPTDAIIYWREIPAPMAVASLPPKEQAVAYYKQRGGSVVPIEPIEPNGPPEGQLSVDAAFREYRGAMANWTKWLEEQVKAPAPSSELTEIFAEIKPILMRNLGTLLPIIDQFPLKVKAKLFLMGLSGGMPFKAAEVPMEQAPDKGWLQSKTLWGVAIMALPTIAKLFGYNVSGEDVNSIVQLGATIVEAAGALLAIIGRVTTKSGVSVSPIVKN